MKNDKLKNALLCFVSAVVGAGCFFGGMYFFPNSFGKVVTETVEKTVETRNVTINDTGIAEAVDKIYDAVVVVKNYKDKEIYSTGTGFVYEIDGKTGCSNGKLRKFMSTICKSRDHHIMMK